MYMHILIYMYIIGIHSYLYVVHYVNIFWLLACIIRLAVGRGVYNLE